MEERRRRPPAMGQPGTIPLTELEELDSQVHHLTRLAASDRIDTRQKLDQVEQRLAAVERQSAVLVEIVRRVEDSIGSARRWFYGLVAAVLVAAATVVLERLRR